MLLLVKTRNLSPAWLETPSHQEVPEVNKLRHYSGRSIIPRYLYLTLSTSLGTKDKWKGGSNAWCLHTAEEQG